MTYAQTTGCDPNHSIQGREAEAILATVVLCELKQRACHVFY
jgi:hypothetical protein